MREQKLPANGQAVYLADDADRIVAAIRQQIAEAKDHAAHADAALVDTLRILRERTAERDYEAKRADEQEDEIVVLKVECARLRGALDYAERRLFAVARAWRESFASRFDKADFIERVARDIHMRVGEAAPSTGAKEA